MHSYGLPDPKYQQIAVTPTGPHKEPRRRAVALDCEMALVQTTTVPYKASELILLCAVDYLTGETLINTHVSPESHVIDWCTKYSGVTAHTMAEAEAQGKALKGWQEARFELWKYIDADTILVGQSLQNDLHVLRMIHTMVVDSAILTNLAVGFECTREWSLKVLCDELLGMKIQTQGKKGHVCVEDAFATREVVLLCCQYPERLETWATVKRKEQLVQQGVRKDALENAKREKAKLKGEQQQAREEALEKAMIERARVKEQQQKVREEGLEIVDGSASKVNEKGGLETEQVQDMEAEKRQEIRREKQRRKRRKQQEKRQNNLQLELEHSRSSVPPSSSRALIGDSAHNDGEALQQSQSSVGSIIREKLLDEHPADKGKALRQSDIAEEVAAAFQPTLNKILGLIKAPSSRAV
ncbi:hypothetical protein MMC18_002720 [Xylographa bjoerkii]|nr:hypothetical protein [Xylographa bjoerkii]